MSQLRALQMRRTAMNSAFRAQSSLTMRQTRLPSSTQAQQRSHLHQSSAASSGAEFDEPSLLSLLEASTETNSSRRAQPDFDEPCLVAMLEASSMPHVSSLDSAEYIIADDKNTKQPVFKQVAGGKPKSNPIFGSTPVAEGDH